MKRVIKCLFLLMFLWFFEELLVPYAYAQRSGNGLFQGTNSCSDVVGQVAKQTYCLDYTTGTLMVWNGTAYQTIGGLPTGAMNTSGIVTPNLTVTKNDTAVMFSGGSILSEPPAGANIVLSSGTHFDTPSGKMIADDTYAQQDTLYHGEVGFFIGSGLTVGSPWYPNGGGTPARTQYMALRDPTAGSGAGLFLESGMIQTLNGGIVSGGPTGLSKGAGSFNGTSYYVNGQQLTQVYLGTVASMGSTAVFHLSNSFINCSLTFDGLGGGHAMATCNISVAWSSITGQNGSVVNIGYLPWVAASTTLNSWFHVSDISGYSGSTGCWLTGTLNPTQSWVTLAYVGPTAACGASGGWLPDTNFAQTGSISLIGQYLVQ
jgi:hypothetical protein